MSLPIKICDKFCHIKGIVSAHTILMCFHKNEESKMEIVKPFEREHLEVSFSLSNLGNCYLLMQKKLYRRWNDAFKFIV